MIKPTVGRVVWFHPPTGERYDEHQPLAAIVTYIWNDRMVNLIAFTQNGDTYSSTSVKLLQDDDAPAGADRWAEWMPYQIGQAKKHSESP